MALAVWLLVALAVCVLVVLFKFRELKHHLSLVIIIAILVFLTLSFASVYTDNKVDLTTYEGVSRIAGVYMSWLSTAFDNSVKIAGYAVKQDWSIEPTNSTVTP